MTILSGHSIKTRQIIRPFCPRTESMGLTYGCGPAGYDVRVEFDETGSRDHVLLKQGQFILASTIEYFEMPTDVVGIVHDKSSWARRGLAVQNTVIEPGWHGFLTLELTNHGEQPLTIRREMAIAQIIFHLVDEEVEAYDGKYQFQERGPVRPR